MVLGTDQNRSGRNGAWCGEQTKIGLAEMGEGVGNRPKHTTTANIMTPVPATLIISRYSTLAEEEENSVGDILVCKKEKTEILYVKMLEQTLKKIITFHVSFNIHSLLKTPDLFLCVFVF